MVIQRFFRRPKNRGFKVVTFRVDKFGFEQPIKRQNIKTLPMGAFIEN